MIVRMCACFVLLSTLAACSEPVPDKAPAESIAPIEPTQQELFKADMVIICDSVKRPEIAQAAAEDRSRLAAQYIAGNIRSQRAVALFEAAAVMAPDERRAGFSAAAAEAGVSECAFLELFQPQREEQPSTQEGASSAPDAQAGQTSSAGLSKDEISKVIRARRAEIRYCYEKALQSNPELKGLVKIAIHVEPSGQVKSTELLETTLSDAEVESCVLTRAKRWVFPAKAGVSVIKYPFQFNTAN